MFLVTTFFRLLNILSPKLFTAWAVKSVVFYGLYSNLSKKTVKPDSFERIVPRDFDGSITTEDTFGKMMQEFPPTLARELLPEIYALRLTRRDGVR